MRCHTPGACPVLWGMNIVIAQAKIKPERVPDVQAAADKMFAAMEAAQPDGIRYAWLMLPDGETFAAVVQADDGVENPIPDLPEYQVLQAGLADALAGPTEHRELTVIGSYRLF
jgi:hypothetical protein